MRCSTEGCLKDARTRGFCITHYHLARRNGQIVVTRKGVGCGVEGCPEPHYAKRYCESHYAAWRAHGDPLKRVRRKRGEGSIDKTGIRWITIHGKRVMEHRHLVGQQLGRSLPAHEHVIHLNDDLGDNRLENLEVKVVGQGYVDPNTGHRILFVGGKAIAEHRHVMQQHLGRVLGSNEYVYHQNEDLADNRLDNLEIRVRASHEDENEYKIIYVEGQRVAEHRWVMSQHLGRPLRDDESVHHKNGQRRDNRLGNLELWSKYQPAGQRVVDKLVWARVIISLYGHLDDGPPSLSRVG